MPPTRTKQLAERLGRNVELTVAIGGEQLIVLASGREGVGEGAGIVRRHDEALDAVADQGPAARHVGGEHGAAADRALQERARQTLATARGQAADVVIPPDRCDVPRRAAPGHADTHKRTSARSAQERAA